MPCDLCTKYKKNSQRLKFNDHKLGSVLDLLDTKITKLAVYLKTRSIRTKNA